MGFALYWQKGPLNEKIAGCGGKTAVVLPTSSPCRVGPLIGIFWTKSQSPRYSPGVGAVVTND